MAGSAAVSFVMKRRKITPRAPVVLTGPLTPRRRKLSARQGLLGKEALEAPVPGAILVLLSRLHRHETEKPSETE